MSHSIIPFNVPHVTGNEQTYIRQALDQGTFSGNGHFTQQAERLLRELTGAHSALLTNSCTAALSMTALVLRLGPGDEVILPSFTFPSSANAFLAVGANIVFADIDPATLCISPEAITRAITPRTKAIVAVHYGGGSADMPRIMEIARAHGLHVIEDAAQAMLASHNGVHLGTIGDLGTLSFHASKNIHCGEGGALLVNNPELLERAVYCRDKGTNRSAFIQGKVAEYEWMEKTTSALANELTAAFLTAQLESAHEITQKRRAAFRRYHSALSNILPESAISPDAPGANGHIFYLKPELPQQTERIIKRMAGCGIQATKHYKPLHLSVMGTQASKSKLPETETASHCLVRLPLFNSITEEQQARVISSLKECSPIA